MRLFIYEYTCAAGAAAHALSPALQAEGWAMLGTLLEDFSRVAEIEALTLLDERCGHAPPQVFCRRVRAQDEESGFRELAAAADWTLLIAPEFDAILPTRCRWVVESGGRLLGPSLAAVTLTADKLALSRHLRSRGVPTPPCRLFVPGEAVPQSFFPAVWKPRDGAGAQATFLVHSPHQLQSCLDRARSEGWQGEALVQPFVPGRPASIAFLIGPRGRLPLLPAAQRLSDDGRFHYLGGHLPLAGDLGARTVALAKRALQTIPGLRGYIGVDVVLGHAENGSEDTVIEINPRPTTSYVGLRALAASSLAEAWLRLALGDKMPTLAWRSGTVQFAADGTVQWYS